MTSSDELKKVIEIINEEEARAHYYIHTVENREKYITSLNKSLIELKM